MLNGEAFSIFLVRCSLERPCLVVYLRIRVKINVSEDQEKDARKVVIQSRAGRKKGGEHSFLNGCSFRGAGITAT